MIFQKKAKSESTTTAKKPTTTTTNTTKPPPLEEPGIQEVSNNIQISRIYLIYICKESK